MARDVVRAALTTRSRVASETRSDGSPESTRDTTAGDTCASAATSVILAMFVPVRVSAIELYDHTGFHRTVERIHELHRANVVGHRAARSRAHRGAGVRWS